MEISLVQCSRGDRGRVTRIDADREMRKRMRDIGIRVMVSLEFIGESPLFDPITVKVGNTVVALRKSEARHIFLDRDLCYE